MTTPRDAVVRELHDRLGCKSCEAYGYTGGCDLMKMALDAGFAAGRAAERADMESLWEAAGAMQELAAGEATKGQLRTMALVLIDRLLAMAVSKS